MEIQFHAAVRAELAALPLPEQRAISHAVEKLAVLGAQLPFPHASKVQGGAALFELRPRAGRSPWRAFYRQVGAIMVISAIGPESRVDPRGFARAVDAAEQRLAALEERD
ncbi:MAG TPA: type II toxin-antitoxin system RelE/ParE family toxin [Chloroflexota bacterium]|nr:type II toxin-antitoxin system RelE/ParE family toxin [Chloroflexota bacterium]